MGNYTENRQSGTTDENPVFRSLGVIEERIREKLTVKNIADSVHFSQYHYQRMFREAVGDSVMGYVTRRRISLAAVELAETETTVLEIALKYGYDSHEGFTRSFRAHMGITPTEYRKYHLFTGIFQMQKERNAMICSKAMEEMIRELNSLIVQAKETAAYTRKKVETSAETVVFYSRFWNIMAERTEAMGDKLTQNLGRITAIAQQPDEISARFLILKTMEDVAFQSDIMAFQAGLTIARARPEHREVFAAVCSRYESLARNARIKVDRTTEFMRELSELIFQDMRKRSEQIIQRAVEQGMAAARELSEDPMLPYVYIADEVRGIVEELSSMPFGEITVTCLEDYLFRLDMIALTADVDGLRIPAHRPLLKGISAFREEIGAAAEFYQSLPKDEALRPADQALADTAHIFTKAGCGARGTGKMLLFYLKGEIEKLGGAHLNKERKEALDRICSKTDAIFCLMGQGTDGGTENGMEGYIVAKEENGVEIREMLEQIYREMIVQAEELGIYGEGIRYIAEELRHILPG